MRDRARDFCLSKCGFVTLSLHLFLYCTQMNSQLTSSDIELPRTWLDRYKSWLTKPCKNATFRLFKVDAKISLIFAWLGTNYTLIRELLEQTHANGIVKRRGLLLRVPLNCQNVFVSWKMSGRSSMKITTRVRWAWPRKLCQSAGPTIIRLSPPLLCLWWY